MPQLFNVVRCFSCSTFQVDQVKKAKKWTCKICGEKQSLIKVYGQGTGRECRQHVQRLNSLRQDFDEKEDEEPLEKVEEEEDYYQEADNPLLINNPQGLKPSSNNNGSNASSSSKWSKFLPEEVHSECFESEITENSSTQEFRTKENLPKTKQKSFTIPYQEKRKKPFSNGATKDSSCFPTKKNRTDFEDSNAIGLSFESKSEKIPHEENNSKVQNLILKPLNPEREHFAALNTNQNFPTANELKKSVSSTKDNCRNNRDCLPYFKKGTNYDRHRKSDLLDELSTDTRNTDFSKTKIFDSSEENKNGQNLGKNIFEIDESEIDLDF